MRKLRILCLQRVVYEMDEVKKVIHKGRDPSQTVIINLTEKELRSLCKRNETASELMNITEETEISYLFCIWWY